MVVCAAALLVATPGFARISQNLPRRQHHQYHSCHKVASLSRPFSGFLRPSTTSASTRGSTGRSWCGEPANGSDQVKKSGSERQVWAIYLKKKKPECAASPRLLYLSWCFEGLTSPWNGSLGFSNLTFNATMLKPSALITWVHLDNISHNWQLFCYSSLLYEVKFYHMGKQSSV